MIKFQQKLWIDVLLWVGAAVIAFWVRVDLPLLDSQRGLVWFVLLFLKSQFSGHSW